MTTGELAAAEPPGAAPRPPGVASRRPGVVRLFAGPVAAVLLVLGAAALIGLSGALFAVAWVGYTLAVIAVPYTVVAVVVGVVGRVRIPRGALAEPPASEREQDVQRFARFSQRASLVLAVLLLGALATAVVLWLADVDVVSAVWIFGGALVAGALFTIGANIPQLYLRRVVALERQAVAGRTGSWRLIVLSWGLSPLMWIGYATTSAAAILSGGFY